MDNASTNDIAVMCLRDELLRSRNLVCGGKQFHVHYCAHILNLMGRDDLIEIVDIIENVRESVDFVNRSDEQMLLFAKIAI